jgi:uncharacterized iron-regulated membrane protein
MTRRIVAQIHLWIGVALCVPLALLGLSGSLLVYEGWAKLLDPASNHAGTAVGQTKSIGEIVGAAQAVAPEGYTAAFYRAPERSGDRASIRLTALPQGQRQGHGHAAAARPSGAVRGGGGPPRRVEVDPVSLQVFADLPSNRVIGFIHTLHANFFLPDRTLVGWFGVAMLALGISGLVNWWPPRRRWREAFVVRSKASGVVLYRQLHGAAGIWAYIVFIVVGLSGIYLAFPQTVREAVNLVAPARDLRAAAASVKVEHVAGAATMPVDEAVGAARQSAREARVDFVGIPNRPDQPYRITLLRPGQHRGEPPVTVFVDPWTGKIVKTLDPQAYSAGETVVAWQHALHAGEGAGPVWQALVFAVGFLPLLFAITGVRMWWPKRARRRPAVTASTVTAASAARNAAE